MVPCERMPKTVSKLVLTDTELLEAWKSNLEGNRALLLALMTQSNKFLYSEILYSFTSINACCAARTGVLEPDLCLLADTDVFRDSGVIALLCVNIDEAASVAA